MSSDNCVVHRLVNWPMVSAALKTYQNSKEYSGLLNLALTVGEESAKIAYNTAYPIYEKMPLTGKINALLISQINTLENAYPAVKMTPEELSKFYYEGTKMESSLNMLLNGKDAVVNKVDNAKSVVLDGPTRLMAFSHLAYERTVRSTCTTLSQIIPTTDGTKQYMMQLIQSAQSSVEGVKNSATKQQRLMINAVFNLATYGQNIAGGVMSVASNVKVNAQKALSHLESRAKQLNVQPEVLLLWWVKSVSGIVLTTSEGVSRLSKLSLSLPESAQMSAERLANHMKDLDTSLNEADSLSQMGQELKEEAGEVSTVVGQTVVDALEKMSDSPPFAWMKVRMEDVDFSGAETDENQNEIDDNHMLPMNPDSRRLL